MLKKLIAGLQWIDTAINAPGFRAGAITGATVTAAVAIALTAVL
jgi:isopropylmalate/homocitrate/citramalate synthase